MATVQPAAFDAVAAVYDRDFTHTPLGRQLRQRVWQQLKTLVRPGQRVLDLACGTGEDAVWLARQAARVVAIDGAAAMTRLTRVKAAHAGLAGRVVTRQVSLQQFSDDPLSIAGGDFFDAALSNFGGLNTLDDRRPLAQALARLVKPGGWLILVVMGPFCPWEIGWYLLHGRPQTALRRFSRRGAPARVGDSEILVWYPSPRRLAEEFSPWFRPRRLESLGLWLPPSYLGHLVACWPGLFARLNRLEQATARHTRGWGDHYLLVLEK